MPAFPMVLLHSMYVVKKDAVCAPLCRNILGDGFACACQQHNLRLSECFMCNTYASRRTAAKANNKFISYTNRANPRQVATLLHTKGLTVVLG